MTADDLVCSVAFLTSFLVSCLSLASCTLIFEELHFVVLDILKMHYMQIFSWPFSIFSFIGPWSMIRERQ